MVQEIHQVLKKYLKPAVLKNVYIMNGKTLEQLACEINAKVQELNPVIDKQELFTMLMEDIQNASVQYKVKDRVTIDDEGYAHQRRFIETPRVATDGKDLFSTEMMKVKFDNVKLDEEKENIAEGSLPAASPDSEATGETGTQIQE